MSRTRPIYGTDLSKPIDELLEEVRHQLVQARGKLSDVRFEFTVWSEQVAMVEGLLTCGLVTLAYLQNEYRKCVVERAEG